MEKIKYDGEIQIGVGKSRNDTHWKNQTWTWGRFVQRIKETHRTNETVAEYSRMTKSMQSEKKDVGGFVAGYIDGGRRKSSSVLNRSMLTLDMDYGKPGAWDMVIFLLDCAIAMYSTHSHRSVSPRLRFVLPLSREADPTEYEAVARYVANIIGIELFDDTTYQPERLMYWPSTSKDGEYLFEFQDGKWLDVDEVLASYRNWKDASEWPVSSRVDHAVRRAIKQQGDPLEKGGVVGAFCRTYDIHQAIETYLSDEYTPCDNMPHRYTYIHGSAAAGLVTYEDKFAYSHHSTDPTSGKLCNAFDLVRLHKFGHMDENVSEKTNATKYPSYQAMEELALGDVSVKKLLLAEKLEAAKNDFAGVGTSEESGDMGEEDLSWTGELECTKNGKVVDTRPNIVSILEHDKRLAGCFAIDRFSNRAALLRLPAWRASGDTDIFLRDDDEKNLRTYLERTYGLGSKTKVEDALGVVSRKHAFHPVHEYLSNLSWDKVERLDTVFIDYLGVEDTLLYRIATRVALTAAVARIMDPGCKFDYTIVLVGEQGIGKSRLLARLAVRQSWFNDGFSVEGKEAYENLRGKWLVEIAELAGIKKADMDFVKRYLTKSSDFYRAAFERYPQDQLRQCVFFGTTNNLNFLRDATGDRRFWPMETCRSHIRKIYEELTDYEVEQIWAEAMVRYKEGQKLYLPGELEAGMNSVRSEYAEDDSMVGVVTEYLNTKLPVDWAAMDLAQRRNYLSGDPLMPQGVVERTKVCIAEIWCECMKQRMGDLDRAKSNNIMAVMSKIKGWEWRGKTTSRVKGYGIQRCFERVYQSGEFSNQNVSQVNQVPRDEIFSK